MASPDKPKPFPTLTVSVARSTPDSQHVNTIIARTQKLRFVDCNDTAIANEPYLFTQGKIKEQATLDPDGCALLNEIDPGEPFRVSVAGRVCFIKQGLFLCNTEKDEVEYGGTRVDWTRAAVADDTKAQTDFWGPYKRILGEAIGVDAPGDKNKKYALREDWQTVMTFWQHEHVTRRDVAIRSSFLNMKDKCPTFLALPLWIRTGPIVRFTNHEKSCIWVETETPALVRVRYQEQGLVDLDNSPDKAHAATVRVGGRHFALVEVPWGRKEIFEYTLELASPPPVGRIPSDIGAHWKSELFPDDKYPKLLRDALDLQLEPRKYNGKPLAVKPLKNCYDKDFRYMYGSCRKHPYDLESEKHDEDGENTDWMDEYAKELEKKDRAKDYPEFCFLGGDQIYGDDIGLETRKQICHERFGARVPGPLKSDGRYPFLVPGAFAGRFAHRFHDFDKVRESHQQMKSKARAQAGQVASVVRRLVELFLKNKGSHFSAWSRHDIVELETIIFELRKVDTVSTDGREYNTDYVKTEKKSMEHKLSVCNDVLWKIPNFERDLPVVEETALWSRDGAPYPPAGDTMAVHACDFAEYAFVYEVAWAKPGWKPIPGEKRCETSVRKLLANVPMFMAFDDHEVTDDWNFGSKWISYLATDRDPWQHWPNTMSDALSAYLVYQHWGNIDPKVWKTDPRAMILDDAMADCKDALPALRKAFRPAITQITTPGSGGHHQQFKWFYKLPFTQPTFVVPDMRTRKMIPISDEGEVSRDAEGHMMDPEQLDWIERELTEAQGPAAFLAAATPYLFPRFTTFAMKHLAGFMHVHSQAGLLGKLLGAATYLNTFNFFEETKYQEKSDGNPLTKDFWGDVWGNTKEVAGRSPRLAGESELDDAGRRKRDFEHMNIDQTWDDVRDMFVRLGESNRSLKTVVFFSGDIHHGFGMMANVGYSPLSTAPGELSWTDQKYPQLLQLVSSGFKQQLDPDAANALKMGVVLFPRDHFFRGMSIRCGGYPAMEQFFDDPESDWRQKQTVLWAQNNVAIVEACFKPKEAGRHFELRQTNRTDLRGVDWVKVAEKRDSKQQQPTDAVIEYWTSDKKDFISEYCIDTWVKWIGEMVHYVEICLWAKDLVGAAQKRVELVKAVMERLDLPEIVEKELKEIIDVVKDPSIQALSRGALSKVYMQVGRNPEALEQAQSAMKFLDEPGGKLRGAEQEAHSAYARALESNGRPAEAAQFRAENPLTTMEPVPGQPPVVSGRGVPADAKMPGAATKIPGAATEMPGAATAAGAGAKPAQRTSSSAHFAPEVDPTGVESLRSAGGGEVESQVSGSQAAATDAARAAATVPQNKPQSPGALDGLQKAADAAKGRSPKKTP